MTDTIGDVAVIERELRRLLRRARIYSTQLARQVHPALDPAIYGLLVDIGDKAPARAADLADELGVTKGVISRQVVALERLGLIERRPDATDARAHTLVLSAAGRRAIARSQAQRHERMEQLLGACDAEELAQIAGGLTLLNGLLE